MPTVAPGGIMAAAASAGTTFRVSPGCWMRPRPLMGASPVSGEYCARSKAAEPRLPGMTESMLALRPDAATLWIMIADDEPAVLRRALDQLAGLLDDVP